MTSCGIGSHENRPPARPRAPGHHRCMGAAAVRADPATVLGADLPGDGPRAALPHAIPPRPHHAGSQRACAALQFEAPMSEPEKVPDNSRIVAALLDLLTA